MQERRKHKRFPVISDLAELVELTVLDSKSFQHLPGVLTNFSAGGMDLVVMGVLPEKVEVKISMHLPGFNRFTVTGKAVRARPKGNTTAVGIQFTEIDKDHAKQINHMADAFSECEARIKEKADIICFHGCTYWDLCEKPVKLKNLKTAAGI